MSQSEAAQHQWIGKNHESGTPEPEGTVPRSFCLQIFPRMLDYVALSFEVSMPTPRRSKKQTKKRVPRKPSATKSTGGLTPRQREILKLVSQGHTNRDIAGRLSISVRTVEVHRFNLMRRLRVRNVAQLLRQALMRGFLPKTFAAR